MRYEGQLWSNVTLVYQQTTSLSPYNTPEPPPKAKDRAGYERESGGAK